MDNWEIYYRTHAKGAGKVLTGSPPLTFVSNGEPLADYRIYGNSGGVGDLVTDETDPNFGKYKIPVTVSGKNLLKNTASSKTVNGVTFVVNDDGSITLNGTALNNTSYVIARNASFDGELIYSSGAVATDTSSVRIDIYSPQRYIQPPNPSVSFTSEPTEQWTVRAYIKKDIYVESLTFYPMIRKAYIIDDAYEPYSQPITTNIYLDKPLSEGESISMSDTGIAIPTINGTNILTVDTAVQQSKMYIEYGGSSNVNQSLMKYLEYKYKFAKE